MRRVLISFFKTWPVAGFLLLAACPQMTTGAISGAGAPLNATGEKTSSSDTNADKISGTDEIAPPPAAAPVAPAPAGGGDAGGLGGAGSGNTEYETAMRRIDGAPSGSSSGEAVPVSGPIAARDSAGGVLSSPSATEPVDTNDDNLRVVYFPSTVRRTWTNADDFFAKLAAGDISDEVAASAKAMHWNILVNPIFSDDDGMPQTVAREEDVLTNDLVHDPGYYLFFVTEDEGLWGMGANSMDVTSAAHLKSLVARDQVDPRGIHFRIRFLGERTIIGLSMPTIKVDPSLLHQPLPGVPTPLRSNPPLLPSR